MRAEFVLVARAVRAVPGEEFGLDIERTMSAVLVDELPHVMEPGPGVVVWLHTEPADDGQPFAVQLKLIDPDGKTALWFQRIEPRGILPGTRDHGVTRLHIAIEMPRARFERFGLHRLQCYVNGEPQAYSPLHVYRRDPTSPEAA